MSEAIHYSRGLGAKDNTPEQRTADNFGAFLDSVLADRAAEKGSQWIAAPFAIAQDDAKHRGSPAMVAAIGRAHRCRDCVMPRRWLGLDADKIEGAEAFAALVAILQPYSGAVWTTHSHLPEAPRCRVLVELDVPGSREQIIAVSHAFRARIDAAMQSAGYAPIGWDDSCDRPDQPLYLPPVEGWAARLEGDPACLGDLATEDHAPVAPAVIELPQGIVEGDRWAVRALESATHAIALARPGERNHALNREAYGLGGFVGAGRLARDNVVAALDAVTAGWDNPSKTRGTIRGGIAAGMAKPRLDHLTIAEAGELVPVALSGAMQRTRSEWPHVMGVYLPRRVVTLLGGHGGVGKSMLALTFAAHVAAGRPWGPINVEQGRAAFLSFEDEGDVVLDRLRDIIEEYDLPQAILTDGSLAVFDGSDADAELATETPDGKGVDFTPMMGKVSAAANGAALVVIDNASDTYGANENNRRQVKQFIRRLAKDAKASGGAVLLLAHIDKQAAKGNGKGNNYSGSTQWHNAVRSRLALVESDDAGIELHHEKANYGPRHESVTLQRAAHGVLHPVAQAVAQAARDSAAALVAAADADAVHELLRAACAARNVPTSTTGSSTTWSVLSLLPEAPAWAKDRAGKRRVEAALLVLERKGAIRREEYRTPARHASQRWAVEA